jgi:Mg2+-importing ATPase
MTTPDTKSAVEESAEKAVPAGVAPAGTSAGSDKSSTARAKSHNIRVSSAVLDAAGKDSDALLQSLHTTPAGLTQAEAEARARTAGPNEVAQERRRGWFMRLLIILRNPLVILLTTLSLISFATGDARAGTVMACMVVLSATLRFVQEARAGAARFSDGRHD